jgi:hypothetical protein
MADVSPPLAPGPYHNTETKTYRLTGPIELVVTVKRESSHVPPDRPPASPMPPPPSPDRDRVIARTIVEGLQPLILQLLQRLERIEEHVSPSEVDPEEPREQ